jgi:hypothetical protein
MTLTDRDKKLVLVVLPLVVLLGYWFLLLGPKREAASEAAATLEAEQLKLTEAQAQATAVNAAKANFARDYSAVVALGKAIPTSVDMPSLLVQLEQAARGTGIKLDGVTMGERTTSAAGGSAGTPGAPNPGGSTPTAPSGQPPQSAPGAVAANAQGTANAASTPPPTSDAATASAGADAVGATPAPVSGPLESVSLEFAFKGSFFELANFFHRLKRFVYVDGEKVRVRGRLLTIDGVEYVTDPETFPALTATVKASVFLTPKAQGATAGATPTGPASPAAPAPVSAASGGSSSPTPTATTTP